MERYLRWHWYGLFFLWQKTKICDSFLHRDCSIYFPIFHYKPLCHDIRRAYTHAYTLFYKTVVLYRSNDQ